MSKLIVADCDWIEGHTRFGHFEMTLDDKELEEFHKLSLEEQYQYIMGNAKLIVDDYEVDAYAFPTNIIESDWEDDWDIK